MSTITSASSEQDIRDAYLDNCGYMEDESPVKAAKLVTVLMAIMMKGLIRVDIDGDVTEFDPSLMKDLLDQANAYITSQSSTGSYRLFEPAADFRG